MHSEQYHCAPMSMASPLHLLSKSTGTVNSCSDLAISLVIFLSVTNTSHVLGQLCWLPVGQQWPSTFMQIVKVNCILRRRSCAFRGKSA